MKRPALSMMLRSRLGCILYNSMALNRLSSVHVCSNQCLKQCIYATMKTRARLRHIKKQYGAFFLTHLPPRGGEQGKHITGNWHVAWRRKCPYSSPVD